MSIDTRATDWVANSFVQMAGGVTIGGGVYFFVFESQSAKIKEELVFVGGGLAGGLRGSASQATGTLSPTSFSSIDCDMPFSLADLDGAGGRLTQLAASAMAGYSLTYISAFSQRGSLFHSQGVHGWTGGVGVSGVVTVGIWKRVG